MLELWYFTYISSSDTRDSVTRIQAESSSSRWAQFNLNHNNSGLNSLESWLLAQCPVTGTMSRGRASSGLAPHLTPAILICKCIDSVLALSQSESVQLALAQSESVAQSESAQGFAANPCASGESPPWRDRCFGTAIFLLVPSLPSCQL